MVRVLSTHVYSLDNGGVRSRLSRYHKHHPLAAAVGAGGKAASRINGVAAGERTGFGDATSETTRARPGLGGTAPRSDIPVRRADKSLY